MRPNPLKRCLRRLICPSRPESAIDPGRMRHRWWACPGMPQITLQSPQALIDGGIALRVEVWYVEVWLQERQLPLINWPCDRLQGWTFLRPRLGDYRRIEARPFQPARFHTQAAARSNGAAQERQHRHGHKVRRTRQGVSCLPDKARQLLRQDLHTALENGAKLEDVQRTIAQADPLTTQLNERRRFVPTKSAALVVAYKPARATRASGGGPGGADAEAPVAATGARPGDVSPTHGAHSPGTGWVVSVRALASKPSPAGSWGVTRTGDQLRPRRGPLAGALGGLSRSPMQLSTCCLRGGKEG